MNHSNLDQHLLAIRRRLEIAKLIAGNYRRNAEIQK